MSCIAISSCVYVVQRRYLGVLLDIFFVYVEYLMQAFWHDPSMISGCDSPSVRFKPRQTNPLKHMVPYSQISRDMVCTERGKSRMILPYILSIKGVSEYKVQRNPDKRTDRKEKPCTKDKRGKVRFCTCKKSHISLLAHGNLHDLRRLSTEKQPQCKRPASKIDSAMML